MRSLENVFGIYVPTDTAEGQDIAEKIADEAARRFGGSTMQGAVGRYVMKDGKIKAESITIVWVAAKQDPDRPRLSQFIWESVRVVGRNLRQESVAVMSNNVLGLFEEGKDYFAEEIDDDRSQR